MSSFHGLEMAKQALFTQQSALYTTGHNIANANTEGYSRQRVNFEAQDALPVASRNRMGNPGQIGTGVKAGSIERIRDKFLDVQFRNENSLAGYWETRADALSRMENVLNDLNETGLSSVMDDFWSSLQDLAVNPTNDGARSVVLQRGIALSETFNYLDSSLEMIRGDLKTEIGHTVGTINNLTTGIKELNEQIKNLEINGYTANDLYDKRDVMIDELSGIIPIDVTYVDSREGEESNPNSTQQGVVNIDAFGETLVDGEENEKYDIGTNPSIADGEINYVGSIFIGSEDNTIDLEENIGEKRGSLLALVEAYGYEANETDQDGNKVKTGDFYDRINDLTELRDEFYQEFNKRHTTFTDDDGNTVQIPGAENFFEVNSDGKLEVILTDPSDIVASLPGEDKEGVSHNGENALRLANVFDDAGIRDNYSDLIGTLAVELQDANRMQENTSVLLTQLDGSRQSVSSVSLDEEMTNLIKFQHAYNAAARSMTATDELLDRIINNMGLVGR